MSSNNRTTSRGGKGPKGDKIHKNEKSETGKTAGEKQQTAPGAGGDSTSNESKIKQVIEMTQLPETKVCLALHECDYDVERAINMLFEIPDSQEWETTVKKKKNRQASASKAEGKTENAAPGGTGDDWNEVPATTGSAEKDKPRNKTGGPQRLHGRHNDNRGWRGRERQENERNLEDSGYRGERRGRSSGSTRGGGGGRGRGGGRAGGGRYPRGNRGGGGSFNNKPMEVWDNSNTWDNNISSTNHAPNEECWDEFPGADEWCGTLSETKVFTPSQQQQADAAAAETESNQAAVDNSVRQAEALAQMQAQMHAVQNPPVAMSGTLNAAQSQYFTQLTQQNNNDLNKYCPPQQSQQASYANTQQYQASQPPNSYSNSNYSSNYGSNVQENVSQQPVRTKTQRARVPPPSKIPSSAVEMPGDINSIGFLDLQFGAMDMMSDSSSFDGVSDNKYQNSSPLDNTATGNNMDLGVQSQNTTSIDAYSPPKAGNQSSISSALSQGLSNADSIPQTSEHMTGGYSSAAASQRSNNVSGGGGAATSTNSTGLEQINKQPEPHPYSQTSTYNSYQPKSTYQNQTYSSNSNYSGTQTTSSYVSNQTANSYVNSDTSYNAAGANSAYPNTYSSNNSYQTSGNTGAFPSISQANTYPSNNQAFQQTSQSVYGANTGLNNSNYSSSSAAQYSSYNSNHKLGKDASSAYENSTAATSTVSNTSNSATTTLSLTQTTASVTKSNTTLGKNSTGVVSNMPPSAPVMSTQYIMGQAVPYFQAPPTLYSHEEMQMIQQRLPYMTTPFYEMSYQTPTTTLRDGSYSLSDGRFTRTDSNASPVPSTQTSTQPMLATQAAGPYYFAAPYNPLQPSYQYGPVYSQLPAGTNAHGSTNSAQYPKPATYGSGYSGYDTLSQSQDYNKGGYVGTTQGQNKGTGANSSSTGNTANDISAMYGKSHTALAKVNSYDKQGFHSGTPPPYSGPLGQSALTPSGTGYAPQVYIPTIPHQQHHTTPLIHQPLHQMEVRHQGRRMDSTNSTGQRSQVNNQQKSGAKQGYQATSSYWSPS